jgi:hypothetical protein
MAYISLTIFLSQINFIEEEADGMVVIKPVSGEQLLKQVHIY